MHRCRAKKYLPAGIPALGCLTSIQVEQHLQCMKISRMTLFLHRSHTVHIAVPLHTPGTLGKGYENTKAARPAPQLGQEYNQPFSHKVKCPLQ